MHFASFVINLLGWTFVGVGLGFFLHKGVKRKQNISIFIGAIFSLVGGVFSSMSHGMWPEIGIDFFNLFVSFLFAVVALYIFASNTRESIFNAVSEIAEKGRQLMDTVSEEQKSRSPYFNQHFWKNITSNLSN